MTLSLYNKTPHKCTHPSLVLELSASLGGDAVAGLKVVREGLGSDIGLGPEDLGVDVGAGGCACAALQVGDIGVGDGGQGQGDDQEFLGGELFVSKDEGYAKWAQLCHSEWEKV